MKLLKRLLKLNRRPLPQTQADMDQLAIDFLQESNLPDTNDMKALFGSFISHADPQQDTFDPELVARMIRKQIANSLVYYLVHPERRPKPAEETAIVSELPDESKA